MAAAQPAPPPIPALTGLRFAAAACVMWAHMAEYLAADGYGFAGGERLALFGMTLFFVLSGFVIQYNYGASVATYEGRAFRRFGVARLARLYPLYVAVLVLDFAVRSRHPHETDSLAAVWPFYATLTQSWFPVKVDGTDLATRYLGVAWSISTEIFLYLFFVIIARPIDACRGDRTLRGAIAALIIGATLVYGYTAFSGGTDPGELRWTLYLSPYCRVAEFSLGALTAALFRRGPGDGRPGLSGWILLVASLGWIGGLYTLSPDPRFTMLEGSWGYAPGVAGLLYFFARYRSAASPLFENRAAVALGDASYSLYLLHTFTFGAVRHFFDAAMPAQEALRMVASWAATFALALMCYRLYEIPARSRVRRALGGRSAVPIFEPWPGGRR